MTEKFHTIGEAARLCGMTARRVRYYSDIGLLPPATRTEAGYRVYSDADVLRLDLIRTLREAGAEIAAIAKALKQELSLRDVLAMRLDILDSEIADRQRLAAVLRAVLAENEPKAEDLQRISAMMSMSLIERKAVLDAFFAHAIEGVDFDPLWRQRMVEIAAAHDHIEVGPAWLELRALLNEPGFIRAMRAQAEDTGRTRHFLRVRDERAEWQARQRALLGEAKLAMDRGAAPDGEEGRRLAEAHIGFMAWNRGVAADAGFRRQLWEMWAHIAVVGRFWHLVAQMRGEADEENPDYRWLERATFLALEEAVARPGMGL